ncbi:T9SS type A sorting domain-containing protein [Sabulibacter ruber]|uniref:T9SS type A sorting domain-containing protein n=1 Tax=Sabulibacter ruber TaxID=2811901 RepID=UPI001A958B36|nr:T9SS type A sorting domain-containing protein [Sabulibacter ruber]
MLINCLKKPFYLLIQYSLRTNLSIALKAFLFLLVSFFPLVAQTQDVSVEWRKRFNTSLVGGNDNFNGEIVSDGEGNIYMSGLSMKALRTHESYDAVLVKLGLNGQKLWAQEYDGSEKIADGFISITMDSWGYINVTGTRNNTLKGYYTNPHELYTSKYSPSGELYWTRSYRPSTDINTYGMKVISDQSGNIYVVGGYDNGIVLIKYNFWGEEQWVKTYLAKDSTKPFSLGSIKTDPENNIYLSGYETTNAGDVLYVAKLNNSGDELWHTELAGASVRDMDLDGQGNIYLFDSYSYSSYRLFKFNNEGQLQWDKDYSGDLAPSSFSVSYDGSLYLTGNHWNSSYGENGTNYDIGVVKYNSDGEEMWIRTYSENMMGNNSGKKVITDEFGDVFVVGNLGIPGEPSKTDIATLKYSPYGDMIWVRRTSGIDHDYQAGISMDKLGNVLVGGNFYSSSTGLDFGIIKYTSFGDKIGEYRYNNPVGNASDGVTAMRVDRKGDVYLTGTSIIDFDGNTDIVTIKYSPLGEEKWVRRYDGSKNGDERPFAMTVDYLGNVIVTGQSYFGDDISARAITTIKYDQDGREVWVRQFKGLLEGDNYNRPAAVVTDASGNVIITGQSSSSQDNPDCITLKYDAAGNLQWSKLYNGTGNSHDKGSSISLDSNGNIIVAGMCVGLVGGSTTADILTLKYSADGEPLWVKEYNGEGNGTDDATNVSTDQAGNIILAGSTSHAGGNSDFITLKYSPQGDQLWARTFGGSSLGSDVVRALGLDVEGNIFITGTTYLEGGVNSPDGNSYTTIKYTPAGNQVWVKNYEAYKNQFYISTNTLTIDKEGSVYVVGGIKRNYGQIGGFVSVKYSNSGKEEWVATDVSDGIYLDKWGVAVGVDDGGKVYVTGVTESSTTGYDILTVKYNQPLTSPLPVTWLSFDGKAKEEGNQLSWSTASETNSDFFKVERSSDGKIFLEIGEVRAKGNSSQVQRYEFTDKDLPQRVSTLYYRIKQLDFDGKFEYSKTIAVNRKDEPAKQIVSVSPNPFRSSLTLRLNSFKKGKGVQLWLFDMNGREMYKMEIPDNIDNEIKLEHLSKFKPGVYLLRVTLDGKFTFDSKLIKQ